MTDNQKTQATNHHSQCLHEQLSDLVKFSSRRPLSCLTWFLALWPAGTESEPPEDKVPNAMVTSPLSCPSCNVRLNSAGTRIVLDHTSSHQPFTSYRPRRPSHFHDPHVHLSTQTNLLCTCVTHSTRSTFLQTPNHANNCGEHRVRLSDIAAHACHRFKLSLSGAIKPGSFSFMATLVVFSLNALIRVPCLF